MHLCILSTSQLTHVISLSTTTASDRVIAWPLPHSRQHHGDKVLLFLVRVALHQFAVVASGLLTGLAFIPFV